MYVASRDNTAYIVSRSQYVDDGSHRELRVLGPGNLAQECRTIYTSSLILS
jgi:hypothetical protein